MDQNNRPKDKHSKKGKKEKGEKSSSGPAKSVPAKPLARTLSEWVNKSNVCVNDQSDIGAIASAYAPVERRKGWRDPTGDHPISHVIRDQSILDVTRDAVARATALYPDIRNLRIMDVYGKARLNWGSTFGAKAETGLSIEYPSYAPVQYAGGLARSVHQVQSTTLPQGCLYSQIVDVYANTGYDGEHLPGVSEAFVRDVCNLVPTRTCYVTQWQLCEPVGGCVFRASVPTENGPRLVTSAEATWITHPEGVDFWPGQRTAAYPRSPVSTPWLNQRAVPVDGGLLHCSPLSAYGTDAALYSTYVVVFEPDGVVNVPPVTLRPSDISLYPTGRGLIARAHKEIRSVTRSVAAFLGSASSKVFAEDDDVVNLAVCGNIAPVSSRLVEDARMSLGVSIITGLKIKEVFSALMRNAMQNSSVNYAEKTLPGLISALVFNSMTVALVQYPPESFVAAVDNARACRQNLEEAQKRIARPDYVAAVPRIPWLRVVTLVVLWHCLVVAFGPSPVVWWDPMHSILWGLGAAFSAGAGSFGGASLGHLVLATTQQTQRMNFIPLLTLVTGSAIIEEVVRSYGPNIMFGLAFYEAIAYIRMGTPWLQRLPAFAVHMSLHSLAPGNFLARTVLHVGFNAVGMVSNAYVAESLQQDAEDFAAWAHYWSRGQLYKVRPFLIRLRDVGVTRMRTFMPDFRIPEFLTHYFETLKVRTSHGTYKADAAARVIKDWCEDLCQCDHLGMCSDCLAARDVEFVYPTLITSGFLYAPRNGNASLGVALIRRTLADPTDGHLGSLESEMAFYLNITRNTELASQWMEQQAIDLSDEPSIAECAKAMGGSKGRNLWDTYQRMLDGQYVARTTMQEKWNEQLKSATDRLHAALKPRLICAVATDDQVHTLGISRAFMDAMKEYFDGVRVHNISGRQVRICIAKTDAVSLNNYSSGMSSTIPMIIVLGDDAAYSSGGQRYGPFQAEYGESDYTQYDQTQFMPHWQRFKTTALSWGLPEVWIDRLVDCIIRSLKGGKKFPEPAKISAKAHPQMHSGLSVTSVLGSYFNITNWINAIIRNVDIEASSTSFGFKVKHIARTSLEQVTFLRGWWQPSAGDAHDTRTSHVWVALPSACLKLGKLFKDPVRLVKGPYDNATKTAMVFRAVMESVAGLPDDYPILGAMRLKARELAGLDENVTRVMNDPYIAENMRWKVYGRGECSRQAVLAAMHERYGITEGEVVEAEALIARVSELPSFISHPVFDKFRMVDYA